MKLNKLLFDTIFSKNVKTNKNFLSLSIRKNQVDSKAFGEVNNELSYLDFNEKTCYNLKDKIPFQYNEFLLCRSFSKNGNSENLNCKLIKLEPKQIYRNRYLEVFHEHIIKNSVKNPTGNVTFDILSNKVTFSRPTLYEFITLKETSAVSSHYSVIAIVPMLLEIGRNSRVLECGTGSGSMTLFLSERLGKDGHLHSFDIGEKKYRLAKEYFNKWKTSYDLSAGNEKWPANVKFGLLNLTEHQFNEKANSFYDAIYLDMAMLNKSVPNVYRLLKVGGVLVVNALHITQALKVLNAIKEAGIGLEHELIMEPSNRLWEMRQIKKRNYDNNGSETCLSTEEKVDEYLDWTCRLEDRFKEKYKRGGLFFNYWSGFLIKFRRVK